ncbi:MAG: proline--tRNA ligase [Puniceicoccaceae bacterium]|nr:MAG: proline--tRNA ligase [Puniceicoccaceae bacterium]
MKLWSATFIPTLKESPAEAEIASHKLLLRAGLVRKLGAGVYTFLPLGLRVLEKIKRICREEMEAAGAIELLMPALHPAENWKNGPRWAAAREVMFSVGGAGAEDEFPKEPVLVLGPTHEEVITPLVGNELSSYRDLPRNFFQIQTKFRNEIRPRFGLMRAKEFLMKDGYSFDADDEGANESYRRMEAAYTRFFTRCGVRFVAVEADTGVMGGSFSSEFMVPAEVGDDDIVFCRESGYAANVEKAVSALSLAEVAPVEPEGEVEEFPTPGVKTIAALAEPPYDVPAAHQFKTLVYVGDDRLFAVVLRGEDEVVEAKLGALGFQRVRPATAEEIEPVMGASPGSLGVVRGTIRQPEKLAGVFADHAIKRIGNGVTGANREGFHLRQVNVERDLAVTRYGDFRRVRAGEPCPRSGKPLEVARAIEVGHVFKLGTKYSETLGAYYSDAEKRSLPMVMGCYGIGISRTLQAVIEQSHDADGIRWPWQVAPFQVLICILDPKNEAVMEAGRKLAETCESLGMDVLVDDRDERPGVKFKDADLIGIPLRLTVSNRSLEAGVFELKWRGEKEFAKHPLAEAAVHLKAAREKAGAGDGS